MRYFIFALLIHGLLFLPLPKSWQESQLEISKTEIIKASLLKDDPVQENLAEEEEPDEIELEDDLAEAPSPVIPPPPQIKKAEASPPPLVPKKKKSFTKKKPLIRKSSPTIITKAISLRKIDPTYPWRAKQRGWEGDSRLEALINKKGVVVKVKLLRSSGYDVLDQAAIKELKNMPFSPATKNGRPMTSKKRLTISFRLND